MPLNLPKVRGRVKKKKFFTILMIPNDENKMAKWRIPGLIIPCLLVFSLIGLATVIYFVYGYFTFQNEAKSLRFLQGINLRQAQEIRNLQARARSLEDKIKSLDELDLKVREMVGLEAPLNLGEQVERTQDLLLETAIPVPVTWNKGQVLKVSPVLWIPCS